MKKIILLIALVSVFALQFCSTSKNAAANKKKKVPMLSWQTDISPVMQVRCTPCHFPETGKKKFLDTYTATRDNIDSILYRIQLTPDNPKFMPWKSKKEPLSDSLIQVFKLWKEQQMPN